MPLYKNENIVGSKYTRSYRTVLENPLDGIPSIHFLEQEIINLGTETIKKQANTVTDTMINPLQEFNLLNPVDDTVIGTAKYQDVYVLLYSLYRHLTTIRDSQV